MELPALFFGLFSGDGSPGMIHNPDSAPFTVSRVWSFFKLEIDVEGGLEKPWNRWEQLVLH